MLLQGEPVWDGGRNAAAGCLLLEPVFAWGTSYLVMGESLEGKALWGAGLILAGIVASEWR